MYSVVLMAALATSSTAPEFGHHSCRGSGSGYGGGCYGSSYTTWCSGSGGWGCYGWGCYGNMGNGCYGGWSGWGCRGGTGWGCYGGSPYVAGGCYGGNGGYGYPAIVCTGGPGCYGGYSGYGVPVPGGINYMSPGMTNPWAPNTAAPITPAPEVTPVPKKNPEQQTRAKVRIEIPADAKLYVDGVLMKTGSAVRLFQTPVLNPSRTYFYELRAEMVRNNQSFTETQSIVVRPGEQASASFAGLEQKAAAAVAAQATAQR